jgi:hypothetical protein
MFGPIVVIDSSEIRVGKLEELKMAIHDLVEFVDSNEPRPIAYGRSRLHLYIRSSRAAC